MEKFSWPVQPYSLEQFSNEELYFIISSLFGIGYPGHGPESLYLSFDNNGDEARDIRFLLLAKELLDANEETEITYFHLGRIDYEFDEIEIYSGRCAPEEMDPKKGYVNVALICSTLSGKTEPYQFHPVTLLKGLARIISPPGFLHREENHLFKLAWNSPLPEGIKSSFDLGVIGSWGTNFSGDYFLVAEPDERDFGTTKVKSFKVYENEEDESQYIQTKIKVQYTFIDFELAESYKDGKADNFSRFR